MRNAFFGGNVSVTGLLTGVDLQRAIQSDAGGGPYLVPDIVFNEDGMTLDEQDPPDPRRWAGKDVRVVSCDAAGLLGALADIDGAGAP